MNEYRPGGLVAMMVWAEMEVKEFARGVRGVSTN